MTDTMHRATSGTSERTDKSRADGSKTDGSKQSFAAPEERGRTKIADNVVEKIAGMAAREVPGVHNLGSGMARTIGGVRERMPGGAGSGVTRGVRVEVGEEQAAVDLDVVVDYGLPIDDVAADIRVSVISAMERMTGLDVVEVNVSVDDIDVPGDDEDNDDS